MTQRIKFFYCNNMENELKSYHNRKTLEIAHNLTQWPVVNTLFQGKTKHHNRKDGSKGNTKIVPVWEVATSYLHGKYGVEIRIMSLNRQHSLLGQNFSSIK